MSIVQTISVEDTENAVLKLMDSGYEGMPKPLLDLVVMVRQKDPYKQALVLRSLRTKLKPEGSHYNLTAQKRWAWYREPWGQGLGLERRKPELGFDPTTERVQALTRV